MLRFNRVLFGALLAGALMLLVAATNAEAAGNGRGNGRNANQGGSRNGAPQTTVPAAAASATSEPIDCLICAIDVAPEGTPLTDAEIQGLLLALNDEYHAIAVYSQVIDDLGAVRPFSAIVRSEQQHAAALARLFDAYDLTLPDNVWLGELPSFASLGDACQAAVDAELLNVDLYAQLNASTTRSDILYVYDRLQSASQNNHLPAFSRCAR